MTAGELAWFLLGFFCAIFTMYLKASRNDDDDDDEPTGHA